MKHASLFSGFGGFDLASKIMGWQNIFWCENNSFCRQVLKYHFKNSLGYGDIKTTDFKKHKGQIDILTGGFPCQPFSDAGLKGGTDDPRYLWPEMYRAVREIRPRWVIAENVRGLISWNAGLVFDTVCTDLENVGYEVWPCLLPACSVNAPHQRYRIWFIAYTNSSGNRQKHQLQTGGDMFKSSIGESRIFTNTTSERLERYFGKESEFTEFTKFNRFPTQSPVCCRDDGLSSKLDGISFPSWRKESIIGYGNAIVPQVAMQIFKTIEAFELCQKQQ